MVLRMRGVGVRISLIELIGYREWTEALGSDREWLIQLSQARLYAEAQLAATIKQGHVLPLRYDYMILLSSNLKHGDNEFVLDAVRKLAPVPVRMVSTCAETPAEAEVKAISLIGKVPPGKLLYEECGVLEAIAVAHIDLNNVTEKTRSLGTIKTYYLIIDILNEIVKASARIGSLAQYLGGDNILVVLPASIIVNKDKLVDTVFGLVKDYDLKAGVGVAGKPRTALKLAADALDEIRVSARGKARVLVKYNHGDLKELAN